MTRAIIAALFLTVCHAALAANTACPRLYAGGERPDMAGTEVCFDAFAVVYRADLRISTLAAERLTPPAVAAAERLARHNAFHAEPSITDGPRPQDYAATGYDKGHLAPSGDMPTLAAQYQSFSMINMVPQTPQLNRGAWAQLEGRVRDAARTNVVYVLTGVIPADRHLRAGEAIPDRMFKATAVKGECEVAVATNSTAPSVFTMTYHQFTDAYGITLFKEGVCSDH